MSEELEFDVGGGWDVSSGKDVYGDLDGIAKRKMKLFFLVDCSGSMIGEKIGAVNATMEEMIPDIVKISEESAEADIEVAVLTFASDVKWITPTPVPVKEYKWEYLSARGTTAFGAACKELDDKLSRSAFMKDMVGNLAPVIILISDGAPTDDYIGTLEGLKLNKWFQQAIKAAIAIGKDAVVEVLERFTGDSKSVVRTYTMEQLSEWIRFVTITASKIGSTSKTGKHGIGDDIQMQQEVLDADWEEIPDPEGGEPADGGIGGGDTDDWGMSNGENAGGGNAGDGGTGSADDDPWGDDWGEW